MAKNQVTLSPATQDETTFIANKIDEFNAQKVPFTQAEPLIHINYVLKDNAGRVIGGITATLYYWNVLFINILLSIILKTYKAVSYKQFIIVRNIYKKDEDQ